MAFAFGPRRGVYADIGEELPRGASPLTPDELAHFETFDLLYRSLCALLYNYVPTSGHPGGSISSGRFVAGILFDSLDYDLSDPDRDDADIVSYAAGHKAMGLYSMWALRDEFARVAAPALLPADTKRRLRLEDLLGFRRNPITRTPLFTRFGAKALDGHPTPTTPFVRLATGASGVGVASSIGLAFGARDYYGADAPRVHIVEGEGGLTPGRVGEALAAAGTASLGNVVLHLDWNQASIDSEHVCRDGDQPGDYVQWTPAELFYLHDWNVLYVPDGRDFTQVIAAQRRALALDNGQPTAIVYRTLKGWKYGVEGKASHGAGHKLCSDGFYAALAELTARGRRHGARRAADLRRRRPALHARRRGPGRPRGVPLERARARPRPHRRADPDGRGAERPARGREVASRPARPRAARPRAARRGRLREGRRRGHPHPRRAAPHPGRLDDPARRARPLPPPAEPRVRRRLSHRRRRPARLDQRERHRRRLRGGLLERGEQPRRTAALHRGHLRRCDQRRPLRHLQLRPPHRRRRLVRRLPRAAQSHRRAPARHRRPGARGGLGRPLRPDDPRLRPRRPEDGRRRPYARRPAAATAAAGELPAGHGDLADTLGAAGDLAARGDGPGAPAGRSSRPSSRGPTRPCSTARRSGSRPPRRPPPGSTCCGGPRASPT